MDRIRYKCTNCKYEFGRKADMEINVCPYCGKPSLEMLKGDYINKMLDEVSRVRSNE